MPTTLNDVPQSIQTLSETQPLIRTNFSVISDAFNVDHVAYNDSGQGKHNQITLPTHTGALPFIAGEIGLFNQNANPSAVPDIWMQRGVGTPIPITGTKTDGSGNGWSYLPSGILIKWGRVNGNFTNGTWQQVTYPTGATIPAFTTVFNVTVMPVSQDTPPGTTTHTFNYITVASGSGGTSNFATTDFWWIPRTNFGNVNQQSIFYYVIGN